MCLSTELLNIGAAVQTCVFMDVAESVCVYTCAHVCERKFGEGGRKSWQWRDSGLGQAPGLVGRGQICLIFGCVLCAL